MILVAGAGVLDGAENSENAIKIHRVHVVDRRPAILRGIRRMSTHWWKA